MKSQLKPLSQWSSTRGNFCSLSPNFGNVWREFWLSQLGGVGTGIRWAEARDAAKHLQFIQHCPVPRKTNKQTTRNSTEVEPKMLIILRLSKFTYQKLNER